MVSWIGVAVGVALTLLAVAADATLTSESANGAETDREGSAGEGDESPAASDSLEDLASDDEELQWTAVRNVRVEAAVTVASTLLVGAPLGLVAGLCLWLVVGLLRGGGPLAGVAFGVGAVAPAAWLLLSRDLPPLLDPPEYGVTDRRLVEAGGRGQREQLPLPLVAIEDVTVESGRFENRLGIGTVTGADGTITFEGCQYPAFLASAIESAAARPQDD